jgi:hypothetical protein
MKFKAADANKKAKRYLSFDILPLDVAIENAASSGHFETHIRISPEEEKELIEAGYSIVYTSGLARILWHHPESRDDHSLACKDDTLEKMLKEIQGMCGAPDAAEACRAIIKRIDEVLLK